jgi:hypothetical protein
MRRRQNAMLSSRVEAGEPLAFVGDEGSKMPFFNSNLQPAQSTDTPILAKLPDMGMPKTWRQQLG